MATDWTTRVQISAPGGGWTTLAKFSADLGWHTRPNDNMDSILQSEVWSVLSRADAGLQFRFQFSDGNKITTGPTYQAAVIDKPDVTTPAIALGVNDDGIPGVDHSLVLANWDGAAWAGVGYVAGHEKDPRTDDYIDDYIAGILAPLGNLTSSTAADAITLNIFI